MKQKVPLSRLHTRLRMRHISLLKALGESNNLRKAAADLRISQPAASMLLQEIEDALQTRLFERTKQGLVPTASHFTAVHWALQTLANLDRAQRDVAAAKEGAIAPLCIGISPSVALDLLPRALCAVRQQHPSLEVSVRTGMGLSLFPMLFRGEVDAIIGPLPWIKPRADLHYEILVQEKMQVIVGQHHPLAQNFDVRELDHYPWILPSVQGSSYEQLTRKLISEGCATPRVAIETTSPAVIFPMLQKDNYLALLQDTIVSSHLLRDTIVPLPLELPDVLYPMGITRRIGSSPSIAVEAFLDALRSAVREPANGRFQ